MRYFHSNKNFNQYKPHQSFWQKLRKKSQKKELKNDDQHPSLKNPYKREVVPKKNKGKIIIIFFILLILIWIVLIFTLPYFKINKIVIEGNKINKTAEVENYARNFNESKNKIFSPDNYFLFPTILLSDGIKKEFLYENVKIEKIFPDTIKITVIEKPASIIYDNNNNYYLLDADGRVIKKLTEIPILAQNEVTTTTIATTTSMATSTAIIKDRLSAYLQIQNSYGQFPVIRNDNQQIPADQSILLSPKMIKAAVDWKKYLKEQGIADIQFFVTGETNFNLKAISSQPWHILINTDSDAQAQIHNLKVILANNKPVEYIDLRFGERVYWK